ncbi:MAG: hypothetical protein ABI809_06370 [Caldimonas sp.]
MTDTTFDFQVSRHPQPFFAAAPIAPFVAVIAQLARQAFVRSADRPASAQRQARAVRALADRYRNTDRGFAADLYVAADRHEEEARSRREGSAANRR